MSYDVPIHNNKVSRCDSCGWNDAPYNCFSDGYCDDGDKWTDVETAKDIIVRRNIEAKGW